MCARAGLPRMAAMRFTTPLLATLAAVLLVPAAAQAGTLSFEGDTLVYRADPGVSDSPPLRVPGGKLSFYEDNLTLGDGCTQESPFHAALCTIPARVRLELGDGDDGN